MYSHHTRRCTSPGMRIKTIINRMIDAGVDYAVLGDGSTSACHVIDGLIHDMLNDVAGIMNRSIATGLMFCKRRRINFRNGTNRGFESNSDIQTVAL